MNSIRELLDLVSRPHKIFSMSFRLILSVFILAVFGVHFGGAEAREDRPVPTTDQQALLDAARHGDTATARALLDLGVPVDTRDNGNWTPLIWAAAYLHADTVQLLIDRGAALETIGRAGKNSGTPLMWAAKKSGGLAVAQILLDAGADVNGVDQYGRTALMLAAKHKRADAIRFLLAAGADINAVNQLPKLRTALETARKYGNKKIRRLLRANGALDWDDLPATKRSAWQASQNRGLRRRQRRTFLVRPSGVFA